MQAHLRTRSRKDDHSVGDSNDTSDDDMDTNTSNIRRSSSFTSGMTTINEQISPEELGKTNFLPLKFLKKQNLVVLLCPT